MTITFAWGRCVAAFVAILLTTVDDSVWLVSFVGNTTRWSLYVRWIHSLIFVATLVGLTALCCGLAIGLERGVIALHQNSNVEVAKNREDQLEVRLEIAAAILCWLMAFGFYVKKKWKHHRRKMQKEYKLLESEGSSIRQNSLIVTESGHDPLLAATDYGAISQSNDQSEGDMIRPSDSAKPWTIISLTCLGFLDELSYFPTLIVGHIFSVSELLLAALAAGVTMIAIQAFLSNQCQPLIEWLDRHTSLYGVIALFAVVLTLHAVWDICFASDD